MDSEKGRYVDRSRRRLYPIGAFNSWTARPLSAALARLRATPDGVSALSLLVSLAGLALVATGSWRAMAGGALLVHLGLVLDHADGQVARRRGMGSTWGMYLDMLIDRIVEVGLLVAAAVAMVAGSPATQSAPAPIPGAWSPLAPTSFLVVCSITVGVMMLWRFLAAYNDLLFLRGHMMATGEMPAQHAAPRPVTGRRLMPVFLNRDWIFLFWLLGILAGQVQATVLLLLLVHVAASLERIVVFRVRHKDPEGDARRILGDDYH